MKNRKLFILITIALLITSLACSLVNNTTMFEENGALSSSPTPGTEDAPPPPSIDPTATPVVCCNPIDPTATRPPNTIETWEGDNMGDEKPLPDMIDSEHGAIAEIWDGASFCALVKILPGEVLDGNAWKGAYWEGLSPKAVIQRFLHHAQEYKATKDSNCVVLESITLLP
jgi:hypothetical protein